MKVQQIVVGELRTNCYVISNQEKKALILDPGDEADKILKACESLDVVGILVTHHHFDHVGALKELEEYYHIQHNTYRGTEFSFEVIPVPGHTIDSVLYFFREEKKMFVGDFLFYRSFGRTDLGGDVSLMKKSILKMVDYEDDLLLYPGHGPMTRLGEEKPYFDQYIKML